MPFAGRKGPARLGAHGTGKPHHQARPRPAGGEHQHRATDLPALWATLFNLRYRALLTYLSHSFRLARLVDTREPNVRGAVMHKVFGEMYNLKAIAGVLVHRPLRTGSPGDQACAAPPFEMPYTMDLPIDEPDCWQQHQDILKSSSDDLPHLADGGRSIAPPLTADEANYLRTLRQLDQSVDGLDRYDQRWIAPERRAPRMSIKALRILPPIAIGRLGSAAEPLVAYEIEADPEHPLDIPRIKGATTLGGRPGQRGDRGFVLPGGRLLQGGVHPGRRTAGETTEHIRPVAPFLEVWAQVDDDQWVPLTLDLLLENGLTPADVSWQVTVANRKVARRTGNGMTRCRRRPRRSRPTRPSRSKGIAATSSMRTPRSTSARCSTSSQRRSHPEIRLRFTPAQGKIYGPKLDSERA